MKINIITPPTASMPLDHVLVAITEELDMRNAKLVAHGALGGSHGYGGTWDSPVFMMHPYCWCERMDCPWCAGCECPESANHYFVDGREVPYSEYDAFYCRETYQKLSGGKIKTGQQSWHGAGDKYFSREQLMEAGDRANARRTTRHDGVCDFCTGKGVGVARGGSAEKGAPNFWHKPSGLRVWWYKWIGRSMETNDVQVDLAAMLRECRGDIRSTAAPPATPAQDEAG